MLYRLSYAGTELDSGDLRKIVVIIRTIPGTDNRLRLPSSPESGSGTPVILMSHKPMTLYHDRHAASPGGNLLINYCAGPHSRLPRTRKKSLDCAHCSVCWQEGPRAAADSASRRTTRLSASGQRVRCGTCVGATAQRSLCTRTPGNFQSLCCSLLSTPGRFRFASSQ